MLRKPKFLKLYSKKKKKMSEPFKMIETSMVTAVNRMLMRRSRGRQSIHITKIQIKNRFYSVLKSLKFQNFKIF